MEGGHHSFVLTLTLSAVNFLMYIFVLYKFLFPKLKQASERKAKEMQSEFERSKDELSVAKRRYEEARSKREKADEEAKTIEEEISKLAATEVEKIIRSAQEYEKKKLEEVENLINSRIEDAKKELKRYALEQAIKLAEEYIRHKKSSQDIEGFFSKIIESIDKMSTVKKN